MTSLTGGGLLYERPERPLDDRVRPRVFQAVDVDAAIFTFNGEWLHVASLIKIGQPFRALTVGHFCHDLARHRAAQPLFRCYALALCVTSIQTFLKFVKLPEQPGIARRL